MCDASRSNRYSAHASSANSSAICRSVRCSESLKSMDSVKVCPMEFSTSSSRFLLRISCCALALRNIEQEALIGGDVPHAILHRDGRLQDGANLAVLPAHFKFEIRHGAVLV